MFNRFLLVTLSLGLFSTIQAANSCFNGHDLLEAAKHGNNLAITKALNTGVDVNYRGHFGQTSLMEAVEAGHEETVRQLLHAGADVNCVCSQGYTALKNAIVAGYAPIVVQLLDAGANVNHQGLCGGNSLHLLAGICRYRRIFHTSLSRDKETMQWLLMKRLLQEGVNVNQENFCGKPPIVGLVCSFMEGREWAIVTLLKSGARLGPWIKGIPFYHKSFLIKHRNIIIERATIVRGFLDVNAGGNFPQDLQGLLEQFTNTPILERTVEQNKEFLPIFAQDSYCIVL